MLGISAPQDSTSEHHHAQPGIVTSSELSSGSQGYHSLNTAQIGCEAGQTNNRCEPKESWNFSTKVSGAESSGHGFDRCDGNNMRECEHSSGLDTLSADSSGSSNKRWSIDVDKTGADQGMDSSGVTVSNLRFEEEESVDFTP